MTTRLAEAILRLAWLEIATVNVRFRSFIGGDFSPFRMELHEVEFVSAAFAQLVARRHLRSINWCSDEKKGDVKQASLSERPACFDGLRRLWVIDRLAATLLSGTFPIACNGKRAFVDDLFSF